MFENEQLTMRLTSAFTEVKRTLDIEGRYLAVNTTQKLARLLGGMALAAVVIFVGGIVLLFASFALAYWLADVMGSTLMGFGIIAVVLAILCILVYVQRSSWIYEPILVFVANIFVSPELAQDTNALKAEGTNLESEREKAHVSLRSHAETLLQPARKAANKWEYASNIISTALAIYEGLRVGHSTLTAVRRVFGGKKK